MAENKKFNGFIYDYKLGRCLSMEYIEKAKPFLPFDWK